MELITKTDILKTISIFKATPASSLQPIADALEDIFLEAGDVVFHKGDLGDALYIIASGLVLVHDGEMALNHLARGEVFGEMALLDPEPRSATVTVMERTHLFKLARAPLQSLMMAYPEITRGIIHVLTHRLRERTHNVAEDFAYIQQFERVTAAAVALENGIYQAESLNEVTSRADTLGLLARVFQNMIREVQAREELLQKTVAELRIEIDEAKRASEVEAITDTEYFRTLQEKAKELRAHRSSS